MRIPCALTSQSSVNTSLPGEKSVDTVSSVFGDLLADVMSFGLEGDTHRVASSVGRALGRIVYITDAADDAFRDIANGSYNRLPRLSAAISASAARYTIFADGALCAAC